MVRIVAAISLILVWTVASLLVHPIITESQPTKPSLSLNNVFKDLLKAESAGARSEELAPLIGQLNGVIPLQDQLQNLGTQEGTARSQLLDEVNSKLAKVDAEATQLEITASQRTYTTHLYTYIFASVGAVLVAVVSFCAFSLWRRYRAKRALEMKIVPN